MASNSKTYQPDLRGYDGSPVKSNSNVYWSPVNWNDQPSNANLKADLWRSPEPNDCDRKRYKTECANSEYFNYFSSEAEEIPIKSELNPAFSGVGKQFSRDDFDMNSHYEVSNVNQGFVVKSENISNHYHGDKADSSMFFGANSVSYSQRANIERCTRDFARSGEYSRERGLECANLKDFSGPFNGLHDSNFKMESEDTNWNMEDSNNDTSWTHQVPLVEPVSGITPFHENHDSYIDKKVIDLNCDEGDLIIDISNSCHMSDKETTSDCKYGRNTNDKEVLDSSTWEKVANNSVKPFNEVQESIVEKEVGNLNGNGRDAMIDSHRVQYVSQEDVTPDCKPFKCPVCGFSVALKVNLDQHIEAFHSGTKPQARKPPTVKSVKNYKFKCSECNFRTCYSAVLTRHFRSIHSMYPCNKCEFVGKIDALRVHGIVHGTDSLKVNNEQQKSIAYKCNKCTFEDNSMANFLTHLCLNSEEEMSTLEKDFDGSTTESISNSGQSYPFSMGNYRSSNEFIPADNDCDRSISLQSEWGYFRQNQERHVSEEHENPISIFPSYSFHTSNKNVFENQSDQTKLSPLLHASNNFLICKHCYFEEDSNGTMRGCCKLDHGKVLNSAFDYGKK